MQSDLTEHGGRFFAADAPWNWPQQTGPVDVDATGRFGQLTTVSLAVGPRVVHVRDVGAEFHLAEHDGLDIVATHSARLPVGFVPRGDVVIVDHRARTVVYGRDWRWNGHHGGYDVDDLDVADLDSAGWGSPTLGLVLERELLSGQVPHAVGLWVPLGLQCYGAAVTLNRRPARGSPANTTVAAALQWYGGIVVGIHDGDRAVIRVEQSASATSSDPVGPTYRQLGLSGEETPLRVDVADIEVLT